MKSLSTGLRITASAVALLLAAGSAAMAAEWIGTSSDYNDNNNWNPNAAPVSANDIAQFRNTGQTTITLSAPVAPDSWSIDNTTQEYIITGSSVTFGAGMGVSNSASGTVTIGTVIAGDGFVSQQASQANATLLLTGVNTYTGSTGANNSTVALSGVGSIASSSYVAVGNGGTFDISQTTAGASIRDLASNGNVALGGKTLTITTAGSSGAGAFTGVIQDGGIGGGTGGGLTISGGSQTLSGANSYTGATTISGGTLKLSGAGAIANSASVTDNASFDISAASSAIAVKQLTGTGTVVLGVNFLTVTNAAAGTLSGVISGTGGFFKDGAGTLTLTAANTYTGFTNIRAGTLALSGSGSIAAGLSANAAFDISQTTAGASVTSLAGTGSVALGGKTLTLTAAGAQTFSGVIQDGGIGGGAGGGLTVNGGVSILSGSNTYTGLTTIASGAQLNIGGATGSLGSGAVTNNGTLFFNRTAAATVGNVISGSGAVFQVGSGAVTLTSANSYTGSTSISTGTTLALSGSGGIAGSSAVSVFGIFDISGTTTGASIVKLSGGGTVALGSKTLTLTNASTPAFSGVIQDGGIGGGTGGKLTVSGGTQTLSGANTYTGGTTISGGTLALSGAGTIANSSSVTNNAALSISGASGARTVNQLTGTGAIVLGANTLTANNAATGTLSGVISGIGGFTKAGAGLLILTGANTYSGATSVTGGVLQIGAGGTAGAIGAGAVALSNNALIAFSRSDAITIANVISGAGRVNAGGTGVVALTGANTYANGTIISSGATLQVGNGGTTGSLGSGAITDNGTLAFNRSDAVALPSGISGSGGISQLGSGVLSITTAQTYTGATTIAAGSSLVLTDAGDISQSSGVADNGTLDISGITAGSATIKALTGTGTIALGSKQIVVSAGTGSFSGSFSGTGTVELSGGTTTLTSTEDNSFQVDSGATLQVGNGGTAGAVTGNIVDNGALAFNRSDTVTAPGVISGTGTLAQIGTGTTILTGANTYSGVTTISAGTLQVGAGGTAGSLGSGAVTDNGILAFNRSDSLAIANAISGTGAVTKAGAGTITLTGANSYSGATTITAGTLQVGNGGTAGSIGTGAITDNGALVFNRSDALTVANAISGTGTLTQNGSGNLILSGTSAFTGVTTVNAGTLSVNGSIASSNVIVNNGGKLGGNGTVGGVTVLSGGTLAPGNSIGTLNVASLSLASGSTYTVEVSPTAADRTNVTGAASLNGTLALVQTGGTYTANTYRLIQAGSLSGTFATVTGGTFTGLNTTVQYSATAVDLILSAPVVATAPVTPPTITFLFNTFGTTPNQIAAGAALTTAAPTAALYVAAGGLVAANTAGVPAALGQLSGDIHASLRSAAVEDSRIIRNTVLDHLGKNSDSLMVWGAGFGGYGSISTDGNAAGLHHDTAGFIAGADMPVGDGFRLGLAGGYTANSASVTGKASRANGNSGHVIAYGGWSDGAIDLKLGGDFGFGNVQVTRTLAAFNQTNTDRQDQNLTQVFADAGYKFQTAHAMVEPYVGIASISATTGAFAETGGSTALSGGKRTDTQTYSTVGLRASLAPMSLDPSLGGITPHVDMGWQHGFKTLRPGQTVTIAGIAQGFTVLGAPLAKDAAAVRAGFDMAITPEAILSLDYDGSFASRVQNNALRGTLQWKF